MIQELFLVESGYKYIMSLKINKKLSGIALSLLMVVMVFAGCGDIGIGLTSDVPTGEYPVTVGTVEITSKPSKVLVVSPSFADIVVALGKETQLVAATDDCTQSELTSLTKVGASDIEAMKALSPDLILSEPLDDATRESLSQVASVVELDPAEGREDFERLYAQVASVFSGGGAGAESGISAARKIFTSLDDIQRLTDSNVVKTGCYIFDISGKAVTGEMFGSTILEYSGVTNVFNSQLNGDFDFDTLKLSNPDVIFCSPEAYNGITSHGDYAQLSAVKKGNVFELPESYMTWQGRSVTLAAYEIAGLAFPELLEENENQATDPTEEIENQVSSAIESSKVESSKADKTKDDYKVLTKGDDDPAVLELQERLDELGYLKVAYDGYYGDGTQDAVAEFQKNNSLEETGIADQETQYAVFSEDAVANS